MYPFLFKIKERLDEKKLTLKWLAEQIGITTKTFNNNPLIADHSIDFVMKISRLLDFDFFKDYNEWLIQHNEPPITAFHEPEVLPTRQNGLTLELKITGSYANIGMYFGDFLKALQKEADKYGFKIE
jgi:hypothetical protein